MSLRLDPNTGLIDSARFCASPNCDARQHHDAPNVIILHCISLPPGQYGGDEIEDFFTNRLDPEQHPYFGEIAGLTVSAHFLIRRDGGLLQFVPTTQRAWHAGESVCLGRPVVNDFSIGIELEGLDTDPDGFERSQYATLRELITELRRHYPAIRAEHLFAHSDIAPGRKPDPGPYFDWNQVYAGDAPMVVRSK